MIETLKVGDQLLAVIVPGQFREKGIHFFTPNDLSQQLAYMRHPVGKTIDPHVHKPVTRSVHFTQEVLVIKKGKLRVDFYDNDQQYLESRVLEEGDVILLATGGHGFEVLEEVEMVEVKQGPYAGDQDKTRFTAVSADRIRTRNRGGRGADAESATGKETRADAASAAGKKTRADADSAAGTEIGADSESAIGD